MLQTFFHFLFIILYIQADPTEITDLFIFFFFCKGGLSLKTVLVLIKAVAQLTG